MNKFSEAYAAAKSALNDGTLASGFKDQQGALKLLLAGANGPDVGESKSLDKLRDAIAKGAKAVKVPREIARRPRPSWPVLATATR